MKSRMLLEEVGRIFVSYFLWNPMHKPRLLKYLLLNLSLHCLLSVNIELTSKVNQSPRICYSTVSFMQRNCLGHISDLFLINHPYLYSKKREDNRKERTVIIFSSYFYFLYCFRCFTNLL